MDFKKPEHQIRFTAGEFAKLHNINKRTLHYYDEIGLFSPSCKGENQYRYYTYFQSPQLEMILAMRELQMPIEEIRAYRQKPSAVSLQKILMDRTREIQDTIRHLKELQSLLEQKNDHLTLCMQPDLDRIDIVEYPREYLVLSKPITGAYDEKDLAVLLEHSGETKERKLYNKSYGSRIAVTEILAGNYEAYECFFTKFSKKPNGMTYTVKPAGKFIRAFSKGKWEHLPEAYRRIRTFADRHGFKLQKKTRDRTAIFFAGRGIAIRISNAHNDRKGMTLCARKP